MSFEKSTLIVACVALIVAAFGMEVLSPHTDEEDIRQQRIDFDMFPGRYALQTEVVSFGLDGESPLPGGLLKESFARNLPKQTEMCFSPEGAKFNVFTEAFAGDCIVENNRSSPGIIDVEKSCSNSPHAPGGVNLRIQGEMTTVAANLIISSEFELAGAGTAKAVIRSKYERLGDCAD